MDKNLPEDKPYEKNGDTNAINITILNTSNIIGLIFLLAPQQNGQKFRVRIVKIIGDHEEKLLQDPGHIQFVFSVSYDQY